MCLQGHSLITSRSSPPELFLGKGVLKICGKFVGERSCRRAISIIFFSPLSKLENQFYMRIEDLLMLAPSQNRPLGAIHK